METKLISTTGNGAAKDEHNTNASGVFMTDPTFNSYNIGNQSSSELEQLTTTTATNNNSNNNNKNTTISMDDDGAKEIVSISCGSGGGGGGDGGDSNVKSNSTLVENKCLINYNSDSNNSNTIIANCDGNNQVIVGLSDNVGGISQQGMASNESVKIQMDNLVLEDSINGCSPNPSSPCVSEESICNQEELDEISQFFEARPLAIEKWLRERASGDLKSRIHAITSEHRKSNKNSSRSSVTSELFQQWLSSSPSKKNRLARGSIICRPHLANLDEGELFMELIRDVANELDIDVLCHKILVNVGLLTCADRGSLFLAKGPDHNQHLVAKLFDVTQDTVLEEAIAKAKSEELIIPFGVGIAGMVAQTKETINIKDAYTDERFNHEIDLKTGYKTNAIVSMPICNYEGDVIGVAQIINKTNGTSEFSERDVEIFRRYLTFCGIGIQNAQLFEMSVQEYRRNQILLNLARSIFEEQNNLECLVTKIMTEAKELLKCKRCAVFLLDLDCCEENHLERILERPEARCAIQSTHDESRRQSNNVNVEDILQHQSNKTLQHFTTIFELGTSTQSAHITRPSIEDLNSSALAQIAECVASTGEILNISDVNEWLKDKPYHQCNTYANDDGERTNESKSILCMPIVNGQKRVIGVAQLINKENGLQFTNCDISIFEAFAIFCGLGIHNTQMYESACKLMAKQKVALECLSYHATAGQDQTMKLANDTIATADEFKLYSFTFIDFDLSDEDTCRATVRMFLQCNLVQQFHIPYDVLCRWILSVRKNYRPVKYHNWRHALNVTQTMFAMLKTGKMERFMADLEILGLLVACLCHDLDHRGTNNAFQTKTESPLAILYTTSTMEHHHFDQCVMILNSEGNNIFQALSPDDFKKVMKVVETAILSTDLAMYFKKRNTFLELIDNGEFDWQSEEKKEVLSGMLMTACDVSAIAKPWDVQHRVAKLVADEFFDQGDMEKLQLNTQPIAMMDRERKDELPKMQVGFIDVICSPLYRVLSETFPWIAPLYEGTMDNRQHWQDLAEKVEMGLTWIDHDTIDKPVEEFAANDEDIGDIEFTVTTLNCSHNNDTADITPPHERKRFSSLRKTGALGKAVRQRLSKSMYQGGGANVLPSEKQPSKSYQEDDKHPSPLIEEKTTDQKPEKPVPTPSSVPPKDQKANKLHKKKSKLCSLL